MHIRYLPSLRVAVLAAIFIVHLSGCAVMLAGTLGLGAGYYIAHEDRPARVVIDDGAITAKINREFAKDKMIDVMDIDVDTYGGVVTLSGVVDSHKTAERAADIANSVDGVKRVVSRLIVDS